MHAKGLRILKLDSSIYSSDTWSLNWKCITRSSFSISFGGEDFQHGSLLSKMLNAETVAYILTFDQYRQENYKVLWTLKLHSKNIYLIE